MSQSTCNKIVFNVLLVLILLSTITYADINSCRKFCNKHRPDGSSAGYEITCAEASGRKGTKMSSCKEECESCSKLCSNEYFRCPRAESFLTAYSSNDSSKIAGLDIVLFIILFILCPCGIPICIPIGLCVWACQRNNARNQYQYGYGMQPVVGQVPMNQYQPYQPQVGGDLVTSGMGQPQNYQTNN